MLADAASWDEVRAGVFFCTFDRRLNAAAQGGAWASVGAYGGAEDDDCEHFVIQCQISHRKQSGRRYNDGVLCGAALGVELAQGIGLNPRGTHMRFVTSRWSLSAAGLISALALAACSTTPAPIAPAPMPMPVMAPAPAPYVAAPVVRKKWVKKHRYGKKKKMRKVRKYRRDRAHR